MSLALRSFETSESQARTRVAADVRPVSVLHVFKYFRPDFTGDGLYFEKLFPRLEREGIRNQVIVGVTRATPASSSNPGVLLFGRGGSIHFNLAMLFWFATHAWRFDVVHLHSAIDRVFAYHVLARLSGCRVVQSCTLEDGLARIVQGYSPVYRPIVRRMLDLIDDVVAISPSLHANTLALAPKGRVHFIPQGVAIPHHDSPSPRVAARQAMGVNEEDTLLLFVGGICPRKDVRFLVENHPPGAAVHLMLVGPSLDDAYYAGLQAAIAASPAAGRIHLAGYMEDPSAAYRAADAFVFASHMEGCPNVLLEAMAHALPAIARRLPGITDSVIDHGRNGILFDTAEQYAEAVERLSQDRGARQAMGAAAHAAVCARYEMDGIALRYAELYRRAA